MHGYNPGQFQHAHRPPPPGGMPPPQQPGVGFNPPSSSSMPPPPGSAAPGVGFAPPPPGQGQFTPGPPPPGPGMGMGGPPPPPGAGMQQQPLGPAGMQSLNAGMAGMNLRQPQFSQPGPPPPAMGHPQQPGMMQPGMMQPGMMGQPQPPEMGQPQPSHYANGGHPAPTGGHPMVGGPGFVETPVDYDIKIAKEMFRMSASKIPATASMATQTKVPTGGILRPFTQPADGDVDVIRPGAGGIIRCHRCRTYINPFVAWTENGRKWRCNVCSHMNETSSAYYCHLDSNNQRKDKEMRPELSKGVVEWAAPTEYQVRPPQPPTYFFVLDVSAGAVSSGMLETTANTIKKSLDELPGKDRTMIGFITFDTSVHYYALAPGSANAQMMVVGDLEELFVPAPTDLLVYLKDSREAVDNLLDNLPSMFSNNTANASCLGPALKAAYTVMKSVGGKMSVFQSVMPNLGEGSLKPRENHRMMGTPDEVTMLRPSATFYRDTALEFSKNHICVDMFVFPTQYIDIASMAELPKVTAGTMQTYVAFDIQRDGPKYESELYRRLTQPTAFEAVLRIRCTKGMRITNFYGNFNIRGQDLLALPNCTPDSVFAFDLNHDEQSINSPFITIQSALLFTNSDGDRRIRVSTQAVKVTTRTSEFMESIDAEAVATLLSKQAMSLAIKTNLDNARNKLQHTCSEMIKSSKEGDKRTVSGYTIPSSQSENEDEKKLPENLELIPLYTLGLMKNVAFRGGTDVNPDERITAHMKLSKMFVEDTIGFIHPRLYGIHNMDPQAGLPVNDDDIDQDTTVETAGRNMILLPSAINLSVESLSSEGIYLLDNGSDTFLWVGRASDAATNSALFGLESLENMDTFNVSLNSSGNDLASRLDSIIQALHEDSENNGPSVAPRINIITEGDMRMEARFFWNFIEDRAQFNGGTYSYDEFVQYVNSPRAGPSGPPGAPGGMGGHPRGMPPAPSGYGGGAPSHPGPPGPPAPVPPQHHMSQPSATGFNQPPAPRSFGGPPPPAHQPGPPQPPSGGFGGPPPPPHQPGPPQPPSGGFGSPPPPAQPRGMPGPPSAGSYGVPPPPAQPRGMPGPPSSGGYGGPPPPPQQGGMPPPPSSGGYGGPPPPAQPRGMPGPPSSGGYGGAPPPPSSGGFGGPPPPPQQGGMPPPPRY